MLDPTLLGVLPATGPTGPSEGLSGAGRRCREIAEPAREDAFPREDLILRDDAFPFGDFERARDVVADDRPPRADISTCCALYRRGSDCTLGVLLVTGRRSDCIPAGHRIRSAPQGWSVCIALSPSVATVTPRPEVEHDAMDRRDNQINASPKTRR